MRKISSPKGSRTRRQEVLRIFGQLWSELFESPVHLDSALSKRTAAYKSILARIVPTILLRPTSQAEAMGIGVPSGEPWSLSADAKRGWRPAQLLAERMYDNLVQRPVAATPSDDDFPPVMVEEWKREWGAETAALLVRDLASEPPLGLRVSRRFERDAVLAELTAGSRLPVSARLSSLSPRGIQLGGYAPVLHAPAYEKGAYEIQDEGSQLLSFFALWPELFAGYLSDRPGGARAADPPALPENVPAWTVVDACAGAGGKSLAIADALKGKGRVYSYDTSEKKLQALRRRARHAGLTSIQAVAVKEGEEAESFRKFRRTAQVVLVDAPCSGWGVLRRNPDIKWRQGPDVLERMPQVQRRLLSVYSDLVAPGGRLVFGVCTFRRAETSAIAEAFLSEHPGFRAGPGGYLGPGPCDGFFMQAFERVSG